MLAEVRLNKLKIKAFSKPERDLRTYDEKELQNFYKSLNKRECFIAKSKIDVERKSLEREIKEDGIKIFNVMYNPESVRVTHNIEWQEEQGLGKSESPVRYVNTKPEKITFQLIFTNTGVERPYSAKWWYTPSTFFEAIGRRSVAEQVEEFIETCASSVDSLHRPYYLILSWGKTLNYPCQLSSVDINYTLFGRNGNPLRAELDVEFIEDQIPKPKNKGPESPDVTHARIIQAGSTLPIMAEKIYQDSSYCMYVAEANKLGSIRNIQPGKSLVFPPVAE